MICRFGRSPDVQLLVLIYYLSDCSFAHSDVFCVSERYIVHLILACSSFPTHLFVAHHLSHRCFYLLILPFSLSHCTLSDTAVRAIAEVLKGNATLTSLE